MLMHVHVHMLLLTILLVKTHAFTNRATILYIQEIPCNFSSFVEGILFVKEYWPS